MLLTKPLTFSFGMSAEGLTDLVAQPYSISGSALGPPISVGFIEMGGGIYLLTGEIPAGTVVVKAYSLSDTRLVGTDCPENPLPSPSDVRSGADRGDGLDGTLVVPDRLDVRLGTVFDNGTVGQLEPITTGGGGVIFPIPPNDVGDLIT